MAKRVTSITTKQASSDEIDIGMAKAALALKRAGYDLFTIAEKLGMTERASARAIQAGLEMAASTIGFAERRELLALEVDRLDTLQTALWPNAMDGDVRSAEAILKIVNQRSRLLGLEDAGDQAAATTVVVAGDSNAYVAALQHAANAPQLEARDA